MSQDQLWLIQTIIPSQAKDSFMDGLEEFADSMSCFEHEGSEQIWKLLIYTQELPDQVEFDNCFSILAAANDIKAPDYQITQVEQVDWVEESQRNFDPVIAGHFFIYPSWRRGEIPEGLVGIEIDPQRAFGTGGHETTKGCMLAMQVLAKKNQFKNMMDMGCGSGILAIAMAKIWPQGKVLAVDYDQVCVDTSIVNAEINDVSDKINIAISDGYASKLVQSNAPYDLIASNILAAPLIEFAPMAAKALADNGYLILSGLLVGQADSVLDAHNQQGLSLVSRQDIGDWSILVLTR